MLDIDVIYVDIITKFFEGHPLWVQFIISLFSSGVIVLLGFIFATASLKNKNYTKFLNTFDLDKTKENYSYAIKRVYKSDLKILVVLVSDDNKNLVLRFSHTSQVYFIFLLLDKYNPINKIKYYERLKALEGKRASVFIGFKEYGILHVAIQGGGGDSYNFRLEY